ncbi:MAG TPA: MFS transporter [Trebonia sp.]|nr:MFS transporter [Trebonia sp.]
MGSVAVAFAVLGTGGTATELSVVFAANIVPQVLFTLGGGVIADRMGRRVVMMTADIARFAAQGALAAAILFGHPSVWLFIVAALVVGTGSAFFQPALTGLTVLFLPRDRLGDANAAMGMARPGAQIAGPALAGVVIAVIGTASASAPGPGGAASAVGPAAVIAVDAATYAVSALALLSLRLPPRTAPPAPGRSLLRDLADGWSEFASRDGLWTGTIQFALFNLVTWGPYLVLGPVLAREYLGGAQAWGAVLACYGAGAIVGGALALGRRFRRPLLVATIATFGYALPPGALALRLPLAAVAGAAVLAGLGSAFGRAVWTTVEQQRIPEAALSRVGAFNTVGAFAFGPVAFIAGAQVAAALGTRTVLGFGAGWSVLCTLAVLAVPSVRAMTWRDDGNHEDQPGPAAGARRLADARRAVSRWAGSGRPRSSRNRPGPGARCR